MKHQGIMSHESSPEKPLNLPPPDVPGISIGDVKEAPPVAGIPKPAPRREILVEPSENPELSADSASSTWTLALLKDVFAYPLRKDGWISIGALMLLSLIHMVGGLAPVLGPLVQLFVAGMLSAYYFAIIASTLNGKDTPPDWPSVSDYMQDIVRPFLIVLGLVLLSFLPLLAWKWWQGEGANFFVTLALVVAGTIYLPMACIAYVINDDANAALPHRVLPALGRCFLSFLPSAALLWLVMAVIYAAFVFVSEKGRGALLAHLPFLVKYWVLLIIPAVLLHTLSQCMLIIHARIVGLIGRRFRDRIGLG
jgi:hypothetical protein